MHRNVKKTALKGFHHKYLVGLRERHNLCHKERTSRIRKETEENGSFQIVENLHTGKDEVVRAVELQTSKNRKEHSILLLYPLELYCCTTSYSEISLLNPNIEVLKPKRNAATVPKMKIQNIQKEDNENM